jgi:hypothetical protein
MFRYKISKKVSSYCKLLPLVIGVCLFEPIYSQNLKNSTKVSYGNFTLDQFFNVDTKILSQDYSRYDLKSKGALFISFSHKISDFILSGASIGSNKITSDIIQNNQKTGILNRYLYTLAIEADFIYFRRQNFQLYAVVGYGYSAGKDEYFLNNGESGDGFIGFMVFQLTPLAIRVGNRIALFSELGFGYKGIASLGFTYRL